MPTMEELSTLYSEDYSDQDGADFRFLSFKTYGGKVQIEVIGENLARQTHEIYKKYGNKTAISVYR